MFRALLEETEEINQREEKRDEKRRYKIRAQINFKGHTEYEGLRKLGHTAKNIGALWLYVLFLRAVYV